jgi:hypothetical protein
MCGDVEAYQNCVEGMTEQVKTWKRAAAGETMNVRLALGRLDDYQKSYWKLMDILGHPEGSLPPGIALDFDPLRPFMMFSSNL